MIKRILVPMGSSEFSKNSLKISASIASKVQAGLALLHVMDTSKIKSVMMSYRTVGAVSLDVPSMASAGSELGAIKDELDIEKAKVENYYEEMKPQMAFEHSLDEVEGDVAEEILKASRSADLIVMAKVIKGEGDCTDVPQAIMQVVKHTGRPLLAVCQDKDIGGHALVAYDGSRSAGNALRVIGDLHSLFSRITVLTVKNTKEEAAPIMEEASRYLRSYGLAVEEVHKTGDVVDTIINTANDLGVSMIFMGGYGDNRLKEILIGSVTEKVLTHTYMPVLLSNG